MKKGKISGVAKSNDYFFIDEDFFCHASKYSISPAVGQLVEYEPFTKPNGKKEARNVKPIGDSSDVKENAPASFFNDYLGELKRGYFYEDGSLAKIFIIDFPQKLAELFQRSSKNKVNQIRKYYDQVKLIEGKFQVTKNFSSATTDLYLLIPLVRNAAKKGHISDDFYKFMEANIEEAVHSSEDFIDGFIPHFQSLIGYYN